MVSYIRNVYLTIPKHITIINYSNKIKTVYQSPQSTLSYLKNGPNKIPIPFKIFFMLKDLAIPKVY